VRSYRNESVFVHLLLKYRERCLLHGVGLSMHGVVSDEDWYIDGTSNVHVTSKSTRPPSPRRAHIFSGRWSTSRRAARNCHCSSNRSHLDTQSLCVRSKSYSKASSNSWTCSTGHKFGFQSILAVHHRRSSLEIPTARCSCYV
jgi:hypothetical protein